MLAVGSGVGAAVRWLLTRQDANRKTEIAGIWALIEAKDKQITAMEFASGEMKRTFDALVVELTRTRNKHSRCEARMMELRQCAINLHGTLKEVVKASANPSMFISDLPEFCVEDWDIDDGSQGRAVDKAVKEVVQNTMLVASAKKDSDALIKLPPNGGKP